MISWANGEQKEIRQLLEKCFTDPDTFWDFYFQNVYRDENTLVLNENGRIISCMQLLPYDIKFYDVVLKSRYFFALATAVEERKKGYMSQMIRHAFSFMTQQNCALAVLIPESPALFSYYEQFGFTAAFDISSADVTKPDSQVSGAAIYLYDEADFDIVYAYYHEAYSKAEIAVLKSERDLKAVIADHLLGNGKIYVAKKEDRVCGISFVINILGEVIIREALAVDSDVLHDLIYAAMDEEDAQRGCMIEVVFKTGNLKPLGMARVLDVSAVLSAFAQKYPDKSFTIEVQDPEIEKNNGIYSVYAGKVSKLDHGTPDFIVDIRLFTQLLFGYKTGSMEEKFHLFPQQEGYINLMFN